MKPVLQFYRSWLLWLEVIDWFPISQVQSHDRYSSS